MNTFNIVVALDEKRGIGKRGELPWHIPADLKHFKEVTTCTKDPAKKNVVIMGRKTWESIPENFRPLPNRHNIVLSRNENLELPENVFKAKSFSQVFELINSLQDVEETFVIGGQQIFEEALQDTACQKLYVTHINKAFDCDTFFPSFETLFTRMDSTELSLHDGISFYFSEYIRK